MSPKTMPSPIGQDKLHIIVLSESKSTNQKNLVPANRGLGAQRAHFLRLCKCINIYHLLRTYYVAKNYSNPYWPG